MTEAAGKRVGRAHAVGSIVLAIFIVVLLAAGYVACLLALRGWDWHGHPNLMADRTVEAVRHMLGLMVFTPTVIVAWLLPDSVAALGHGLAPAIIAGFLIASALVAWMGRKPWSRLFPETPQRMREFRATIEVLRWEAADAVTSIGALFAAVDRLAEAEVEYYFRRRRTRAWISGVCRTGAWGLGSLGVLAPLMDGTGLGAGWAGEKNGYALLVGAGCFLAANALFAGTAGHVRFVSTQLELERLITERRVAWQRHRALKAGSPDFVAEGFAMIREYAAKLHATTLAETGRWGDTILDELSKYGKHVQPKSDA